MVGFYSYWPESVDSAEFFALPVTLTLFTEWSKVQSALTCGRSQKLFNFLCYYRTFSIVINESDDYIEVYISYNPR